MIPTIPAQPVIPVIPVRRLFTCFTTSLCVAGSLSLPVLSLHLFAVLPSLYILIHISNLLTLSIHDQTFFSCLPVFLSCVLQDAGGENAGRKVPPPPMMSGPVGMTCVLTADVR